MHVRPSYNALAKPLWKRDSGTVISYQNELNVKTVHARTCHLCEANCGVLMHVEDGVVTSVKGNPDHVLSEGYICPKATAIPDIQNDPDRLRHPVKRVGSAETATWQEISWEQAYQEIAAKHAEITRGVKVASVYLGNPNVHNYASAFANRTLIKTWGAKGIYSASTLDQIPHMICQKWVYGHNALYPVPDIDRTQYMLCVGGNPLASNGSLWTVPNVKERIKRLKQRGGKFVVIDPRITETAKFANQHHFIKPGTDTAFFLALLNSLDTQDLINPSRLGPILSGWERALEAVREFDAIKLSNYCGIDLDVITEIASELGNGQPAIVYGRMGVSVTKYGTLNHWLIQLLNLATGNVDREGGVMFPEPIIDPVERSGSGSFGRYKTRLSGRPDVLGELPSAELAAEIITEGEGQIGALMVVAGNPVLSAPGGRQLDSALASLDLMVSLDMYVTETSRHAHYILPPCGPLQRDHYPLFFTPLAIRNYADYSPALLEKGPEDKSDYDIVHELAEALRRYRGDNTPSVKMSPREILDQILKASPQKISLAEIEACPNGYDMGPLKPRLPDRLKTDDKRIHCAPDILINELEAFRECFIAYKGSADYLLIGRRHIRSNNSWLHNSHRLIKGPDRCTLMLHPDDAKALNVKQHDRIRVFNHIGEVKIAAEITEDIMPGVISIPHGFGHGRKGVKLSKAAQNPGVSINDLTDPALIDDLSGNAVLNAIPVKLEAMRE